MMGTVVTVMAICDALTAGAQKLAPMGLHTLMYQAPADEVNPAAVTE